MAAAASESAWLAQDPRQLASDADHAAGLAWQAGDLDRAAALIAAARTLDPDRAKTWAQREATLGRAAAMRQSAPPARQPARPPERPPGRPGFCPDCRTSQLTHGRQICQACGVLRLIRARDADAEAGR